METNVKKKGRLNIDDYVDGILNGNRVTLSKAITLIESTLPEDMITADVVLEKIFPHSGKSLRIGITGVPGVGKSTFIEVFGLKLTEKNKKVAVLALDPSSQKSGGSILGDKTRMEKLANNPLAYIRPSPTGTTLGGVGGKTRETILLCEAAGFEIILLETVGVGQSEVKVHGMVDFFLLLMLAGAGDELQGIKRGIIEMADAIAITKADGTNQKAADQAKNTYQNALHLFSPSATGWQTKVLTCSALKDSGLEEIWELILEHHTVMLNNGSFLGNRNNQNLQWMFETIKYNLEAQFFNNPAIKERLYEAEDKVLKGKITARVAAKELLSFYNQK